MERLTSSSPSSVGKAIGVDATGNVVTVSATTTDLSGYIPYTGATTNVNLNARTLSNVLSFNDLNLFAQIGVDIDNIGIGSNALISNTGVNTIGIGTFAAGGNSGNDVVAIGVTTLNSNTGTQVVGVGNQSLYSNSGAFTTAVGHSAGRTNTGTEVSLLGAYAGDSNKGASASLIGTSTGRFNTGSSVVAVGTSAARNNFGHNSSFIGFQAGEKNIGSDNISIGQIAGRYNIGVKNTIVGTLAESVFAQDTANAKNVTNASTDVNVALNRITITSHGFGTNGTYTNLYYTTTGTAMGGFSSLQVYQFLIIDSNTIESVDSISSTGTDTHTFTPKVVYNNSSAIGASSVITKSNQVTLGDSAVTEVDTYGAIRARAYGAGTKTGTPTYNIVVDANGNFIETSLSGATSGVQSVTGTQVINTDPANPIIKDAVLEKLDEGNGPGYRVFGTDPTFYGNIGLDAFDLSYSDIAGTYGATGTSSFAVGNYVKAAGYSGVAFGDSINSTGVLSFSNGSQFVESGYMNSLFGVRHEVASLSCTVVGQAANIISEQILDFNATPTKALLVVGNGTITNNDFLYTPLTRSDAFIVRLNGAVEAPSLTVSAITNSVTPKVLVTKEYVNTIRPYKTYVALLTQTVANAPIATVLENTLGGAITWSRTTQGRFLGTLTGAFVLDKTTVLATSGNSGDTIVSGYRGSNDTIELRTLQGSTGVFTDSSLTISTIEIRVYN
jgi:hypothetical protein